MAAPICHCEKVELDNFKGVYKFYKRRDRRLNTDNVLNVSYLSTENVHVEPFPLKIPETSFPGLKPVTEWKAFQLKDNPGLIIIPNPFEARYQRYWVLRCLLDFPLKPNTTNLDAHMQRPSHIWETCTRDGSPDLRRDSLLMKMRWATLGYQYEWNTKEYFSDRLQQFPDDLHLLCRYIADTLGYPDFSSESGIVNYYRMESTLMGHTDVSELEKAAPLISFSFGQDCIFLSGGLTKATEPTPVFLHSGDICLMTGHARLSYHAVPRILNASQEYLHSCFHGDASVTMETGSCDNDSGSDKRDGSSSKSDDLGSNIKSTVQNGGSHEDNVDVHDNGHRNNEGNLDVCENRHVDNDGNIGGGDIRHADNAENADVSDNGHVNNEEKVDVGDNVPVTQHGDTAVDIEEDTDEDPYSASNQQSIPHPNIATEHSYDDESADATPANLSSRGNKCTVDELGQLMDAVICETDWEPFETYLSVTRLNANVRQVLKDGLALKPSPETVVPLPCPGLKT